MGGSLTVPRGAAPRCPACPAGVPISPEKWGERGPGASPLDPRVYGPLVPTRSFWRLWRIVPVEGLFRCPCTCPDLGRFFVWGCTTQRLPLGGKLSPKVTDEGATDLPNGAEEVLRRGDSREPPFLFLQGKVGYQIAPSSDPALPAHLPPKGKALGREEPSVADFRPSQGPE